MPTFFSIRFAADSTPVGASLAVCARLTEDVNIMGFWPNDLDCMPPNTCGCIKTGYICAPRGDDTRVVVSVYDTDGDEFDLAGTSEIVFIVADGELIGGNMNPGGSVLIEKRLTTSGIQLAGTGYQFIVTLTDTETATLPRVNLYFEARVTTSAGLNKTVLAGIFKAENTMIKDI